MQPTRTWQQRVTSGEILADGDCSVATRVAGQLGAGFSGGLFSHVAADESRINCGALGFTRLY